jgi:hypothetical protein
MKQGRDLVQEFSLNFFFEASNIYVARAEQIEPEDYFLVGFLVRLKFFLI